MYLYIECSPIEMSSKASAGLRRQSVLKSSKLFVMPSISPYIKQILWRMGGGMHGTEKLFKKVRIPHISVVDDI